MICNYKTLSQLRTIANSSNRWRIFRLDTYAHHIYRWYLNLSKMRNVVNVIGQWPTIIDTIGLDSQLINTKWNAHNERNIGCTLTNTNFEALVRTNRECEYLNRFWKCNSKLGIFVLNMYIFFFHFPSFTCGSLYEFFFSFISFVAMETFVVKASTTFPMIVRLSIVSYTSYIVVATWNE